MRTLGAKSKRKSDEGDKNGGKTATPGPVFRAAPMPEAKQPPPVENKKEPAPQKPDIKLPADAIKAGKRGSGALKAHVDKVERQRKAKLTKASKLSIAVLRPHNPKTRASPPSQAAI